MSQRRGEMYYVWDAQIRYWGRWVVRLELDWTEGFPPSTTTCAPIPDCLPPALNYRLTPMKAPLLDLMWSASSFDLYSPAARIMLGEFGATYEEAPAVIRGSASRLITLDYSFVHVTSCVKAVDWEHSDVDVGTNSQGERTVRRIRHLVLKRGVIPPNTSVFRLDEWRVVLLVSEEFRMEWERRGLTGALFRSLDHYPKP